MSAGPRVANTGLHERLLERMDRCNTLLEIDVVFENPGLLLATEYGEFSSPD